MLIKINTSITALMSFIILFIMGTVMFFQYKSSNEFALLTTQKVFDRVSDKVINQIQTYDTQSIGFINLAQEIKNVDDKPVVLQNHTILPVVAKYITNANYVYGIYLGYKNDNFYIVYNLDLSPTMRIAQKAPKEARWLIKKNVMKNGSFISFKEFVDKEFKTISTTEEPTNYKPTKRPWYIDAYDSDSIVKTNPYIFSSIQQPGVTYAQKITSDGIVLSLDITLSSLNKLLSSQNLVKGSAAFIFKDDGKPVAQFNQISDTKIENLNKSYPNSFIKNGKVIDLEEQKVITINGIAYLKYTTKLKSNFASKDYLTIISPMDTIMKPYSDKIYEALGITLLVLILFVMPLVIYAVGLLVKPILQLGNENKKIENGKFEDVEEVYSFMIEINGLSHSLVSMANAIKESQRTLESKVKMRTLDLEEAKKEVELIHKHTRDSIEYAALIQGSILPDCNLMGNYFKDYFVHWLPKDTVGGDIWLFNELRHKDECLLFFIDCTGHGVPGAFVTMIVKSIEREIVSKLLEDTQRDISPAWIMSYFNQTMKVLLKQETKDSQSNAGWDGGVIYYNKQTQILKFAGAETPLFYVDTDGTFNTIKGNRYSVGYKKCKMDYQYKETILEVKEGMKFYCTTDGFLDQNGGAKDFPFGKKKFGNIIKNNHMKVMNSQKGVFIKEMEIYESMMKDSHDRNDDMTVIAFEIGKKSTRRIYFNILKYSGDLTQGIISHSMETIETKIENMGTMGKVATVAVELLQNMMNYSKTQELGTRDIKAAGSFDVLKDEDDTYYIQSKNIMSIEDKEKVEPKLIEIQGLDSSSLKKRYRELRKSGENTHGKGGGIGFYEIAKQVTRFEYNFEAINEDKFYFEYKGVIEAKRKREE
ncbi:MAG: SiaB family protein kinase [Campylobacterota bacterium]|nr:SiaB family protein kinase [Campylobacterota bacterium]